MTAVQPSPTLSAAEQAARQGLLKVGGRPPLHRYAQQIWQRRHFTLSLARARAFSKNTNSFLGQLWAILTPLLWAALYFFIFGMLLETSKGVGNFATFLVAGLFMFRFIATAMNNAATCMSKNQSLITSLQFPRALVPMAYTLAEFLNLIPALGVLLVIGFLTGEPLAWQLALLVPAALLALVFAWGLAMIAARLVVEVSDLANLIPFVTRAMMYLSGVFFSIEQFAGDGTLGKVLTYQPVAVFIELTRSAALSSEVELDPVMWVWGVGWALLFFLGGSVFFWQAEAKYGRG